MDAWIPAAVAAAALLLVPRLLRGRVAPAAEVRARIAAGAAVLDVRSPGEFAGGAFPGAVNVPLAGLTGRLGQLDRSRPVVVYCASGARSGAAARLLRRSGFDVVNAGGLGDMPA